MYKFGCLYSFNDECTMMIIIFRTTVNAVLMTRMMNDNNYDYEDDDYKASGDDDKWIFKKKFISSQIKTKKPLEIKIFHDLKAKKKKKKIYIYGCTKDKSECSLVLQYH